MFGRKFTARIELKGHPLMASRLLWELSDVPTAFCINSDGPPLVTSYFDPPIPLVTRLFDPS